MYGKYFASTFTGSMVGSGAITFATWGYIIANANQDGNVEINPTILAAILGCEKEEVDASLEYLMAPDENSRTPDNDGRRLTKYGTYLYSITTFEKYQSISSEEKRREYQRNYMREYREEKKAVRVYSEQSLAHIDIDTDINKDCARFDEFWEVWPKKERKAPALAKWKSKRLAKHADAIIADVKYRKDNYKPWKDGIFMHPATYLNQEAWNDEIGEAKKSNPLQGCI